MRWERWGGKRRACVLPERLRDASCLTIEQNVERTIFYFSYLRFRLRPTAAFNKIILSSLLSVVFVFVHGCDTQDSLTRGGLAVCAVNWTVDRRSCCSHCNSRRSIASYSSRIATFAYPTCIRRPL